MSRFEGSDHITQNIDLIQISPNVWEPKHHTNVHWHRSILSDVGKLTRIEQRGEEFFCTIIRIVGEAAVVVQINMQEIFDLNPDLRFVFVEKIRKPRDTNAERSWWSQQLQRIIDTGMGST